MTLTSQDTLKLLADVAQAKADLKEQTKLAHAAIRDLKQAQKSLKLEVQACIEKEVKTALMEIADGAAIDMRLAIRKVIDDLANDWRERLGL